MLSSLQVPYKIKNLLRTNPMWHKRDTMTQAHYVQSGNGHFNAGAQKNLTVLSVRLRVAGLVDRDLVVWVEHITSGFDPDRVGASLCQIKQSGSNCFQRITVVGFDRFHTLFYSPFQFTQ